MIIRDITRLIVLLVFIVYHRAYFISVWDSVDGIQFRFLIENINYYIAGRKLSAYVDRACVWDFDAGPV